MVKDNWQTPPELFDKLNDEFDFHGDVACSKNNKMCSWGLCVEDNDALNFDWYNNSPTAYAPVYWMNPPYSRGNIDKFCKKAYEESQKMCVVVGLLPLRSASWFHKYVMKAHEIRFCTKRIKFIDPDTGKKTIGSPNFDSIIVVWKPGYVENPKISSYEW